MAKYENNSAHAGLQRTAAPRLSKEIRQEIVRHFEQIKAAAIKRESPALAVRALVQYMEGVMAIDSRERMIDYLFQCVDALSPPAYRKDMMAAIRNSALCKHCEKLGKQQRLEQDNLDLKNQLAHALARQAFLEAQQQAQQVAACKPYIQLFARLALPIQLVLGIARTGHTADQAFLSAFFHERVVSPIRHNLLHAGLSLAPAPADEQAAPCLQLADLAQHTAQYRSIYKDGTVDLMQRNLVRSLYQPLLPLAQMQETSPWDLAHIQSLAQSITEALQQHHIYPLFRDDPKLAGQPALLGRFTPVSPSSILYPGLFWEESGTLTVFSAHVGVYATNMPPSNVEEGNKNG